MAGDWIKFERATIDKPEVLEMAEMLNTSADDVIGKLLRVWLWFDLQSRNGDAGGVTGVTLQKFIDRLVASQGFAACMKKVGWLTDEGIPNFEAHNGESAKNRALTQKRMKKKRDADVTQETSPEKRREEKSNKDTAPVARKRSQETTLPEDFAITDRVLKWAAAKGQTGLLELHFEAFVSTCKAKGYTYADWDEAFMNAIRNNWAKLKPLPADGLKRAAI